MARSDPEKLARALRANLIRRKSGAAAKAPAGPEKPLKPPPQKPRPAKA